MWGRYGSEQAGIMEAPDSRVAVLAHCHHDSFFLVHVQGQVGILVHVPFVLPYTLIVPQVPQLDRSSHVGCHQALLFLEDPYGGNC